VSESDAERPGSSRQLLETLRALARSESVRVTVHAHQEMVEEDVSMDDVLEAVATGTVIENYPTHRRGPCCLVSGATRAGRALHVVCTTAQPFLAIITVYEPKPPKWLTAFRRS